MSVIPLGGEINPEQIQVYDPDNPIDLLEKLNRQANWMIKTKDFFIFGYKLYSYKTGGHDEDVLYMDNKDFVKIHLSKNGVFILFSHVAEEIIGAETYEKGTHAVLLVKLDDLAFVVDPNEAAGRTTFKTIRPFQTIARCRTSSITTLPEAEQAYLEIPYWSMCNVKDMIKAFIIAVSKKKFINWLQSLWRPATDAPAGARAASAVRSHAPVLARRASLPSTKREISEYKKLRRAIKSAAQNVGQLDIIDHAYLSLNGGNLSFLHGKGICAIICSAFFHVFIELMANQEPEPESDHGALRHGKKRNIEDASEIEGIKARRRDKDTLAAISAQASDSSDRIAAILAAKQAINTTIKKGWKDKHVSGPLRDNYFTGDRPVMEDAVNQYSMIPADVKTGALVFDLTVRVHGVPAAAAAAAAADPFVTNSAPFGGGKKTKRKRKRKRKQKTKRRRKRKTRKLRKKSKRKL